MKKQYSKPNMKCVKLRGAEQLMSASGQKLVVGNDGSMPTVSGGNSGGILSNEEGMDIWGNNGSIWK